VVRRELAERSIELDIEARRGRSKEEGGNEEVREEGYIKEQEVVTNNVQ